MKKTAWLLLLSILCLASNAAADVKQIETSTALRAVYFFPNAETELITVGMVILSGEVDVVGPEGLSHYLEHLMFWHADTQGSESMHARGGSAWVDGIISAYYNTGEASEMDAMFEFTRRLLTPPASDLVFMQEEKKVVAREYDLRMLENPEWRVLTDMRKKLYAGHPLGRSTIGTPDSIMSLTVEQARAFHQQYYLPSNAVLFVSGNLSESAVTEWVNKTFEGLEPGTTYTQPWRKKAIKGELDESISYPDKTAKSPRLAYTALSTWAGDDALQDQYTIELVSNLLQSALPGSLAKPLRLDNFIVSGYDLGLLKNLENQVELVVLAYPDAGITLKKVRISLQEALAQLGISGVPVASLERLRKRMLQTARRESSDVQISLKRALHHLSLGLEPNDNTDHIKRIENVTKTEVDNLLAALGKPQRRVSGLITGE